jgi:tRNA dimethylallyltransferase
VVAVVGPTASGKTELAIDLARRLNGELISADSRQIFKDCDVGTNKPTAAELGGISCHLIDMVEPGQPFTVADYQRLALSAISLVSGAGKVPILQGGTGLYVRALLDGWNMADAPPDPPLRAELERRIEEEGVDVLHAELRRIDPQAAERTQRNPRRIIRALEIHAVTGRPPSEARRSTPPPWRSLVLGLDVPLDELDRRIEARVDRMIDGGLIDEVKRIKDRYPTADLRLLGHGYPEVAAFLQSRMTIDEARVSTIRQVRQYARRQLTWFRADNRVRWIAPDPDVAEGEVTRGVSMMGPEAVDQKR